MRFKFYLNWKITSLLGQPRYEYLLVRIPHGAWTRFIRFRLQIVGLQICVAISTMFLYLTRWHCILRASISRSLRTDSMKITHRLTRSMTKIFTIYWMRNIHVDVLNTMLITACFLSKSCHISDLMRISWLLLFFQCFNSN